MRTGQQWITTRAFTAVIASALVLPALVPFFEAFRLRSIGLFLTGLFFLLGFGVSYYILLRWFLEMDTAARPSVTRQFSIVDLEEHQVSQGEHDRAEAGRGLKSGTQEVRGAG
ncbi:hypothetical protein [Candidatus Binatus sp.]|uniref:hypothetical protein n=1 Tax=Candidatus Binatus sp. TaxID=2811406 RepID=UPI003BAF5E19